MTYLAMILLANCTLYGRVEVISPQGQCSANVLPHETKELPTTVIPAENNATVILVDDSQYNEFVETNELN